MHYTRVSYLAFDEQKRGRKHQRAAPGQSLPFVAHPTLHIKNPAAHRKGSMKSILTYIQKRKFTSKKVYQVL